MDFEKFKSWALEDVSSRLPEEYDGAELYFEEIKIIVKFEREYSTTEYSRFFVHVGKPLRGLWA